MADAPDRRQSDRVADVLEEHADASIGAIERLDRWVHRIGYLCIVLCVTTLLIVVAGFASVKILLDQLQADRYKAIVGLCQSQNKQSLGIRVFVQDVAPDLTHKVRNRFPIEPSCDDVARRSGASP